MAVRKVTAFKKLLEVEGGEKYGSIIFRVARSRREKRLDLKLAEFLALSHLLENDVVFYETQDKYFFTEYERAEPENPTPRA